MKTVLIYHPRTDETGKWYRTPLESLSLARMIDNKTYNIKIIDGMIDEPPKKIISSLMDDLLCVGISMMTGYQIKDGLKIAKFIKEKNKEVKVIVGGWHVSILPEQSIKNKYVDIIVRGQGEITFKEVVEGLYKNEIKLKNILGITYKENDQIISNPERPLEDINNFPPTPYKLLDVEKYITKTLNIRTINYLSSVGCPFKCAFCADRLVYKRRWNALHAGRVINEIKNLVKKYNINGIIFEDSNFFVDKKRVVEICNALVKKKINILWDANGRSETLIKYEPELMKLLADSGCKRVLIGAESGSEEVMKLIEKGATVNDTLKVAELLKKYKITGNFSFMVGFPKMKEDDFIKTIDLAKKIKKIWNQHEILIFFYGPYPGTPLYNTSLEYGFKEPKTLEEWGNFDLRYVHTPWVEKKRYEKIISFYVPVSYITNIIKKNMPFYIRFFVNITQRLALLRLKYMIFYFPFEWWSYLLIGKRLKSKLRFN